MSRRTPPSKLSRIQRLLAGYCPNCARHGPHYISLGSGKGVFICEDYDKKKAGV